MAELEITKEMVATSKTRIPRNLVRDLLVEALRGKGLDIPEGAEIVDISEEGVMILWMAEAVQAESAIIEVSGDCDD